MVTFNRIVTFMAIFIAAAAVYEIIAWTHTLKQIFSN